MLEETALRCFYCGHDDGVGDDCDSDNTGPEIDCQMDDPEDKWYGDSCYVMHSGKIFIV